MSAIRRWRRAGVLGRTGQVEAQRTWVVVCGWLAVLALAAVGSLVAPAEAEAVFGLVGAETRFSFMGPNGSTSYDAFVPVVAYNAAANEYLAVWVGDDNTPPLVDGENEIYAQRISGAGVPLGARIRVSRQGPDGDASWRASDPTVAYNAVANEYLVVWAGRIATSVAIGDKSEIWGRRLSATGEPLGASDDIQISNTGLEDNNDYDAFNPSVAANSATGEYLVVWEADDVGVDDEFEIFGQRLTAAGAETGSNDFRVSTQGADGNAASDAFQPSVGFNPVTNEYLVAWEGEIGTTDVFEIWAQRLSADGAEVGGNDFQLSEGGYTPLVSSFLPSVVANPKTGEYLVVWEYDDNPNPEKHFEIHGQRLTAAGAQTGTNDFQISEMVHSYLEPYDGITPSVAASPVSGEYVVVWSGDDDTPALVDDEFEIYGQRLTAAGAATGADDFRISFMGPDRTSIFSANAPSVAAGSKGNQFLVLWSGDDDTAPPFGGELEIYGRRLAAHFGRTTLVTLALAARRVPARGPVRVRIVNRNEFAVTGRLTGRLLDRRMGLKPRAVNLAAHKRITMSLRLPLAMRRLLGREGRLSLRLTLRVKDPVGNVRIVKKKVLVALKR
jgi:hypothetical protein